MGFMTAPAELVDMEIALFDLTNHEIIVFDAGDFIEHAREIVNSAVITEFVERDPNLQLGPNPLDDEHGLAIWAWRQAVERLWVADEYHNGDKSWQSVDTTLPQCAFDPERTCAGLDDRGATAVVNIKVGYRSLYALLTPLSTVTMAGPTLALADSDPGVTSSVNCQGRRGIVEAGIREVAGVDLTGRVASEVVTTRLSECTTIPSL
ncbi:hypothetical protein [Mycolicibacterium fortuitum]|uniref:hypothetical protein n=1 Tax=Mycolicibacterium fortuitum TaxID=1766 RepID=UPI001041DD81|nr:hypothetical protein [Mycolicibacterium fortuitum]